MQRCERAVTAGTPRIGYVCKVYPRFSETFIVTEVLAHERAGAPLEIFSLRPPVEGRFHELLAEVRSPVTYLEDHTGKLGAAWSALAAGLAELPGFTDVLPELLAAEPRDALQAVALARAALERGVTHLHAHFASVATTVTRLAARAALLPYSFTAHAKDIFHDEVDQTDLARKLADAATVVTVSQFNVTHLESSFGPLPDLRHVYNGLDLARFPFTLPAVRPAHIVSVGRLVEKKGFTDLLDAVAIASRSHPDLRCTLVGTGPLEGALRQRVVALGIEDRVRMTGALPQAEVRRTVATAAAFAAPCIVGEDGNRDGLPTVLLEAMALGTPCISTDVTGIPEVLDHEITGLMVGQGDPPALAGALLRLVDDADLRCRLAAAARALVVQHFDSDRQAAVLRQLFSSRPAHPLAAAAAS